MELLMNDFAATAESEKMQPGKKQSKKTGAAPAVSGDVIRSVRRGATIAMILAAGISARTLFQLGRIIGLPWQFAWMLPGAFDVYAFTSATAAASIPAAHPARRWAVWNARVALSFTMIGNSLVHALYLMSHGQKWTGTDYALTAMSAIPPIIVERLLHLQTKIASDGTSAPAVAVGTASSADQVPTAPRKKAPMKAPSAPTAADRGADGSADEVPPSALGADGAANTGADESADGGADVIDMATAGAAAKRNIDQWAAAALPLYRHHITTHNGAEPNAPQLADAIERAGLGTLGKSRARDVRKATAELHETTPWDRNELKAATR